MTASPDFADYLRSIIATYAQWWKPYAFMDEIDELTWFEFELDSKTQDKLTQPGEKPQEKTQLVLQAIADYTHEKILIVGSPGAGKSTLLARILWQAAERAQEDKTAPILVLVELKLYSESGIWGLIQTALENCDLYLEIPEIKQLVKDQRLLLLADGFNELPTDRARTEFKQFCGRSIPLIITSRDAADGLGLGRKLDLQPPSSQQVAQFLEERLPHSDRAQLKQLGDRVRDLGQTPLMIWMLYSIFQAKHEIPETRGEAYRTFTTLYAERAKEGIDLTESRFILSKLAFEMMRSPKPDDPTDFRLDISEVDAQILLGSEKTLKRLVDFHLLQWQGKPGNRKIRFCHQSLQEYYAAEHLLQQLQQLSDVEFQQQYLNYVKWTEPIALMLALVEDEAQAIRVVELAIGVDLMLGARLAGEVQPKFQGQSVNLVDECPMFEVLKIKLLELTESEAAIKLLLKKLEDSTFDLSKDIALALHKLGRSQIILDLGGDLSKYLAQHLKNLEQGSKLRESFADMVVFNSPSRELDELFESLINEIDLAAVYSLEEVYRTLSETLAIVGKVKNELDTPKTFENVLTLLENSHPEVRASAARILGMLGAIQGVEKLVPVLKDSDPQVREAVAEALGKFDDRRSTSSLLRALKEDPEDNVRYAALNSISELGVSEQISDSWDSFYKTENWQYISAIASIQARCQFYNYEIFQAAEVVQTTEVTVQTEEDLIHNKLDAIAQGFQKMSDVPKYNFPNAQKVQIFEQVDTYIENNHAISSEEKEAIAELKQVIQDLQTKYPNARPEQQSIIIEAEFQEIKQKRPWRWRNLLSHKRLLNGGKTAAVKVGEHFAEENPWGKGAIGFLEGVTEEIE